MASDLFIMSGGGGSGAVLWSGLGSATASLTLSNANNPTTFNQTSAVSWIWANTTTATSGTTNASPIITLQANYWNGSASVADQWTIQSVMAAGTNQPSQLKFTHTGSSSSSSQVVIPRLSCGGSGFIQALSNGFNFYGLFGTGGGTGYNIEMPSNGVIGFDQTTTLAGADPDTTIGKWAPNEIYLYGAASTIGTSAGVLHASSYTGNLLGTPSVNALTTPSAPTITKLNGTGSTTWGYRIVAKDNAGNVTAVGPAGTVTNQNATLSSSAINEIIITRVAGATSYDVYRTTVGTSPNTTGKIGTVSNYNPTAGNVALLDAGSLTLSAVANASGGSTIYTGTIAGGTNLNGYIGCTFVISGFTNGANNGPFTCVASTTTTLTLNNASGVAETHAGTASQTGDGSTPPSVNTTGSLVLANSFTPATSSASGVTGQIAWDSGFIYVCVAANTWKRSALSTW